MYLTVVILLLLSDEANNVLMSSPVSHYHHVVCGSPQRLDDTGVAGDHDDAGKDEGDDDLVPGEVDAAGETLIKW